VTLLSVSGKGLLSIFLGRIKDAVDCHLCHDSSLRWLIDYYGCPACLELFILMLSSRNYGKITGSRTRTVSTSRYTTLRTTTMCSVAAREASLHRWPSFLTTTCLEAVNWRRKVDAGSICGSHFWTKLSRSMTSLWKCLNIIWKSDQCHLSELAVKFVFKGANSIYCRYNCLIEFKLLL